MKNREIKKKKHLVGNLTNEKANAPNVFKEPANFLSNIKTVFSVGAVMLLAMIYVLFKQFDTIINTFKSIGSFISNKTVTLSLPISLMIFIIIGLFAVLILSIYLMRASHMKYDNEKKSIRYISRVTYFIGNIYWIVIESLMYLLVFLLGFTISFPADADTAMEFLIWPTGIGLTLMVIVYSIFSIILNRIFHKFYSGFLIIEERKWNRDGIDVLASVLFIISIVSSLVNIFIDEYKFDPSETQLLFGVATLSIILYAVKFLKTIAINVREY